MFHRTLLDAQLSSPFCTPFSTLAPSPTTSLSLLYPSTSPSAATLQGGSCFGRLAEQSPPAGHEPKSLIEVSCEHTLINLPSGKDSLDQKLDDLSTTVDASEVYDRSDMGRLTSPLFSGARSECYPTQCFWLSDTFKRGETHAEHRFVLKRWETRARRRGFFLQVSRDHC